MVARAHVGSSYCPPIWSDKESGDKGPGVQGPGPGGSKLRDPKVLCLWLTPRAPGRGCMPQRSRQGASRPPSGLLGFLLPLLLLWERKGAQCCSPTGLRPEQVPHLLSAVPASTAEPLLPALPPCTPHPPHAGRRAPPGPSRPRPHLDGALQLGQCRFIARKQRLQELSGDLVPLQRGRPGFRQHPQEALLL